MPNVSTEHAPQPDERLVGKHIRWTWTDGPVKGSAQEHFFREDGSLQWASAGAEKKENQEEEKYSAFQADENIHVVSYLASSGYTLTALLNFADKSVTGIASNETNWSLSHGVFEVLDK